MEILTRLVFEAYEKKEYRPVAVAIIRNNTGQILLVQSAKNFAEWSFPQGGIEINENPFDTLYRELQEELGISPSQIDYVDFKGWGDLDAESTRADKRGFTKGKRYLFFSTLYYGPSELKVNLDELNNYEWVDPDNVSNVLATTRSEKRDLILKFITD